MKRVHLLITGRVQGVYFRRNTSEVANKLDVKGFVRNLDDGRVEVVAEGTKYKIKKLIMFCRKGKGSAVVSNIKVIFEKLTYEFNNFIIKDEVRQYVN